MNITDAAIRNPVLAWMMMLSTALFGIIAASRIGVSQFPDVDYPNVSVSVSWAGAAPTAVEREIIEPLEQALAQVEGVQEITSSARQGSARITCSFDMSRNVDLALQDVQAKVAQAQRSLPTDVQSPTVSKSNPDDTPILTIGVSGPFSRQYLADVARYQVQDRIQTVSGVGQITLNGYLDRNIRIWVDADKMEEKKVAVTDITNAIKREHVDVPGGQFETGGRELSVRLLGEALDLDTFRALAVKTVGDVTIHLSDVALVEDGFEDENSIARLDGIPLQALGVLKQRGTNAVAVAKDIRAKVAELQTTLPKDLKVEILSDSTVFIEESVNEIELELVLALLLTAMVCWIFLGSWSSTLNVLLAIPMSLLGTVAVIYFLGFTLNTFTLLGLSLSVGLVVDDAVMVMENIFRHAEMGKDRKTAASEGTKEITFAALAATLAVVAIFLPVVFMDGVVGRFFFQFGVTLSIAVLLSYLEAITLAPARCAQILNVSREDRSWVGKKADILFERLERLYGRALKTALAYPWVAMGTALVVAGITGSMATRLPVEFVPSQDQSRLIVRLTTASGTNLQAALPTLQKLEQQIAARPEVDRSLVTFSGGSGNITLMLVPPDQRKKSAKELLAALRTEMGSVPGVRVSVQDPSQQSFGAQKGSPVDFTVRGADWDTLVKVSNDLMDQLQASGLVVDLRTDYQLGSPEVQVLPDRRRAAALGVSVSDVGTSISALIGGNTVGKFSSEGRRIDIRMRLMASQRERPEDLLDLPMRTAKGDIVPLSMLVTEEEHPVLQSISRVDRERAINITGNVPAGKSQQATLDEVVKLGAALPLGYRVVLSGQSTQLAETTRGFLFALLIGIGVAYMILASQFNSLLDPLTVLTILPLALCGAVLGLWVVGASLNVFSMIGVLLLMGLVKKNSIMLVEYASQIREHEGATASDAMQRAGPIRLRPILMTTVATMMSAVPAVLGLGPGSETRGPMSAAVLGGLIISTALSLLVVPAFYVVSDRLKQRLHREKPEKPALPPPPETPPGVPPAAPGGTPHPA